MEKFDVIVIGGGPIGCNVASNLAKAGLSVAVIEAKTKIGFPNHCSGLVPIEFLELTNLDKSLIINYIKGAKVFSCKENDFQFKRDLPYAAVIDRSNFDIFMESKAKENGAKFFYNAHIENIDTKNGDSFITLTNGNIFNTKVIVVATGATSAIQKILNVEIDGETIYTVQVDTKISLNDTEIAYIYMNNHIANNWFAWIIPTSDESARVGFGNNIGKNLLDKLDMLFKNWSLLSNAKISGKPVVWSIPIGIPKKIAYKNILFVGDAARQVKPFSGGGLLTGFIAGNILSETIIEAFKDNSNNFFKILETYDSRSKKALITEFKREIFLRDVYISLTDEDKDQIIKNLNSKRISQILIQYGFMDKPAITGIKLLFNNPQIPLIYLKRKILG
ncbi:geranylgeranyl reductase family protein [Caldisericum sp. AR60]|uniref:geranylgeranyl reductase family protein n=1 Tax=Caldisericum sp. AR60 TaxID=3397852 RepID=UPI0039FC72B2